MRRAVGAGLALAIAGSSHAVRADPAAPQVSPVHFQREDARLLEDQQRELDRDAPAPASARAPAAVTPVLRAPAATTVVTSRAMVATGAVLLGVAAISGATSLALLPLDTSLSGPSQGTYDTLLKVFAVTAAISGVTGVVLLASSRSTVQVAPTASARSVGLAVMGRI